MRKVICVYKPLGHTPLEMVEKVKEAFPEYKSEKIGYAGRLDPMAEGMVLLLIGEENKKRKDYERLPKEYEFDVLFGVSTDSYDVLGIIDSYSKDKIVNVETKVDKVVGSFIGKQEQEYPPYSSARVKGKPLYYWSRTGNISKIEIPKKKIHIYEFLYMKTKIITKEILEKQVYKKIFLPIGQFRQEEIRKAWELYFEKYSLSYYFVATFSLRCSSGTYVRKIAHEIGKMVNVPSLAFRIRRKSVGEYVLEECLSLEM